MFASMSVAARSRVPTALFAPLECWVSGSNRQRIIVDRALRAAPVRGRTHSFNYASVIVRDARDVVAECAQSLRYVRRHRPSTARAIVKELSSTARVTRYFVQLQDPRSTRRHASSYIAHGRGNAKKR